MYTYRPIRIVEKSDWPPGEFMHMISKVIVAPLSDDK